MPEDFDPKAKFLGSRDNAAFVIIMTEVFPVEERCAWGSLFLKAERSGWVK